MSNDADSPVEFYTPPIRSRAGRPSASATAPATSSDGRTLAAPPEDAPSPDSLSHDEEVERDRLLREAHAAKEKADRSQLVFGQRLRDLNERRLYREGGVTFESFVEAEFGITGARAYQFIALADVHDELQTEGVEPLTSESHARAIAWMPGPERARAVTLAREAARSEGVRLAARHLQEAASTIGAELEAEREEAREVAEGVIDAFEQDVVAEDQGPEGLLVVAAESDDVADVVDRLPSGVVVRWEGWSPPHSWDADDRGLLRSQVDEVAAHVWPVFAPSPWGSACRWEPRPGPLRATFYPERMGPATPADGEGGREATVLVAPEVDLLAEWIPDRLVRDVVQAIADDPTRRYLVLTAELERAAGFGWPANAVLLASATGPESAALVAEGAALLPETRGFRIGLVLRGVRDPVSPLSLAPFDWVLLRGASTSQAAYDAVTAALRPRQCLHVAREVRARVREYPPMPTPRSPPQRPVRRVVPLRRREGNGPALPATPA